MKRLDISTKKHPNTFTLVSDEDFDFLNQWKWSFDIGTGYATRGDKFKNKIYIHRVINDTPKGMETDHVNRNKLDNRRSNLASVSSMLNRRNTGLRSTNKSGHKGISFWQLRRKWQVSIYVNYKKIHLGTFADLTRAIEVREQAERIYWA